MPNFEIVLDSVVVFESDFDEACAVAREAADEYFSPEAILSWPAVGDSGVCYVFEVSFP